MASLTSQDDLFARLNELQTSIKDTLYLIQRLAILRPDDEIDANGSGASSETFRADLAAEVHDSLRQHEEELDLIQQDVEDVTVPAGLDSRGRKSGHTTKRDTARERDAAELVARCSKLSEDLKLARIRFRRAQLSAKRNADQAQEQERAAYIASLQAAADAMGPKDNASGHPSDNRSPTEMRNALFANRRPTARNSKQTQDDMVLEASTDLTSSLRRTHALLTDELSRSQFARETLEQSNANLEELNQRYGTLDDLLAKSRGLLGTLVRSNKSDTWYLQTTLYLLGATIAWLLFRRLLYGPLWWFVYLPFRLWWGMSWWVLSSVWGIASTQKNNTALISTQQPLRVMPSASNRAPTYSSRGEGAYIPVGAGGAGAKVENEERRSNDDTPLSDMVAKLAEASQAMVGGTSTVGDAAEQSQMPVSEGTEGTSEGNAQGQQGQQQGEPDNRQPVQRGDGGILRERDEATEPRNPKKRMWEEPPQPPAREQHREL